MKRNQIKGKPYKGKPYKGEPFHPPIIALSTPSVDYIQQINALPQGGVFIFRHYHDKQRFSHARLLAKIAKRQKKKLLIAGDSHLAFQINADGVHHPEWQMRRLNHVRRLKPHWLISAATHNLSALHHAKKIGVDFALLSPILPSHQGQNPPLGVCRLALWANLCPLPIVALGGIITLNQVRYIRQAPIFGWAGIRAFTLGAKIA